MNEKIEEFWAHSENEMGEKQSLKTHLRNVAEKAASFAEALGCAEEARYAGMLHDIGKYGDLFQKRLRGLEHGVDHWSLGAWQAMTNRMIAAGLCIQGHHMGLQIATRAAMQEMNPKNLIQNHPLNLKIDGVNAEPLIERLNSDGLQLIAPHTGVYSQLLNDVTGMLDIRMLFSTLVDADYLDTEAHFKSARQEGLGIEAEKGYQIILNKVAELERRNTSSESIREMRHELWQSCILAAQGKTDVYTLSAPTGSGKTLSMLGFAYRHAMANQLRRVVLVIPYLSIIDQTAQICRDLFENAFGAGYVIEHHSMAGIRAFDVKGVHGEKDEETHAQRRERELSENWDAPLIITTSVQLLESLFSNSPHACRKLHRLAHSVILFDEVQTLPLPIITPTLATLSWLSHHYNSTVVFSTATQPAFDHLNREVMEIGKTGWKPRKIVSSESRLFEKCKRVRIQWKNKERWEWERIGDEIAKHEQVICIVNLKKHAIRIIDYLREINVDSLFHLSTSMCPAHREKTLDEIRLRLSRNNGNQCRLISTQCIEAGVDVDFPFGMRMVAPLDSIAQAAGRVNRNGWYENGELIVFAPDTDENIHPSRAYEQGATVTNLLLNEANINSLDIDAEYTYEKYYTQLYDISKPAQSRKELLDSIKCQDFKGVAEKYKIIPENYINVLIPWQPMIEDFRYLCDEVKRTGITTKWIRKARPITVSMYRPRPDSPIHAWLEAAPIHGRNKSNEWFIYWNEEDYNELTGLQPPDVMCV